MHGWFAGLHMQKLRIVPLGCLNQYKRTSYIVRTSIINVHRTYIQDTTCRPVASRHVVLTLGNSVSSDSRAMCFGDATSSTHLLVDERSGLIKAHRSQASSTLQSLGLAGALGRRCRCRCRGGSRSRSRIRSIQCCMGKETTHPRNTVFNGLTPWIFTLHGMTFVHRYPSLMTLCIT